MPATYFRNNSYSIVEVKTREVPSNLDAQTKANVASNNSLPKTEQVIEPEVPKPVLPKAETLGTRVSAFSLASIKAKKEFENQQLQQQKHHESLPSEKFSETDMLLLWTKFAQKLSDQGKKLMATYMQMNDPKLKGTVIELELPNESTKEEFLSGANELLGYLRGKLHNHDITIEVIVNEVTENRYAFTPQEKYDKLKSINPNLDLLKKMFDLDL
ncbi:hypothetical protein SAMN05444337_1770 [Flavobacterium haoranii]|uniref:DNA polymerase-3 subunit gamma/tau n=2 Tax=Flavobacterium haoranii TaxID=683124 RepID=A0A1M6I5M5_9FLAO|nr:hypothetical protein SAMN05444337_1770 [Flavobacterium haoranii]